ncbi:hypothetical protein [Actinoplanes xinjiangensis]|uniref:hypothetical protein n=1 Tax=Actinoplanes xinjiangensis TaxID=512350 RepID=UPI00341A1B49
MSVFRAAASDPAHRPPDAAHPASPGHRVPHQRTPEPGYPDGPTEPLVSAHPSAPAEPERKPAEPERRPAGTGRPRRAGVIVAVLFSLLALLVSGAGGWFSWRALEATRALTTPPQFLAPMASEPAPTRPPQPAQYPVAYAKEPLRLQVPCAAVLHIDLDEPRADANEVLADLRYDGGCGTRPPRIGLGVGAAGASRQVSTDAGAADCDRAIRTGPLGRGPEVEVRAGTALCVLTAAAPAALVLLEIIDVGGSGTAGLRATSWQVPGGG